MRCFIRCGITRKCDYPADVRAQHGLDSVKVSPVIADLVAAEDDFSAQSIFVPNDAAPPPNEEEWMHEMGLIMDINPAIDDELELLQDFRSGYDDLQYARELEAAEDEEARATTADAADPSESVFESDEPAPTIPEQDTVVEGDAPPRKRARYSKEQLAILQREYDRGTSRLSNKEIAVAIDLKPEGIGRKVAQDDVKNWMYAKARRARSLALLSSGAGQA